MEHEPASRVGRPPSGREPSKNRNIRLNDEEWQIFCNYFGPAWLREKIAAKITELKETTNY